MSVIGYLIHLRLQHASYLLQDRNLRVKEIAQQVGYDDICYFSKLFKKHYEISPSMLRGVGKVAA